MKGSVRGMQLERGRGPATLPGMTQRSPFRYFRTSPEIIRLAVMMYVRFPLSLRNVEDLLHERGIEVSHETVRFCWQRFGPMFAAEIRRKRVTSLKASRWRWHLDEVFVKVNGVQDYLWRAVDHEGEVLEAFVSKRRDKKAALKFLKKLMKRHGRPVEVVTDKLRSYEELQHLRSSQRRADHDLAGRIGAVRLKDQLRRIQTNCGHLSHGRLL